MLYVSLVIISKALLKVKKTQINFKTNFTSSKVLYFIVTLLVQLIILEIEFAL